MSFIWPIMLLSLLLVPLCVVQYVRVQRQRRRMAANYGSFGLAQEAGRPLAWRRHLPPALFLAGLTVLMFALARPQTVVSLPRIEGTVILVFDVSGSMAADDLKPTRMEAAKAAALDFVQRQPPSVRIGVVAFSDSGFAVQTPTDDQEAILTSINRLTPARGTSLANGILAALNAIIVADEEEIPETYSNLAPEPTLAPTPMPRGTYAPAVIVLLTDGENNERPDPLAAAQAAADRGVRIHTVGIGSTAGTILHVEGFTVHTRLDEAMLKQISQITDGLYYNAANEEDLRTIYDNLDPQLVIKPETMEVTSLLAGVSILVMLIGGVFSLVWFSRLP